MKRVAGMGLVLALAMLLTTGCDKIKQLTDKGDTAAAGSGTAASSQAGSGGDDLGQKLNQFIVCINKPSSFALRSRSRYLGWVDPKTGPTGQEKVVYGLFEINLVDQCKKALKKAKTMGPATPDLDKASVDYEKALDELIPLVDKAHAYYKDKKYKEDAFKQGKEMHAPLMAAFDKFSEADKGLRGKIAVLNDKLLAEEIEDIAKNQGKKLLYHWKTMMMSAKKLIRLADVGDLPDLDADKFDAGVKVYEAAVKATGDYASANGAETKKVMMFSMALDNAKGFLTSASSMLNRKKTNKAWSQSEIMMINGNNGWMVDGHPEQVVRKYNDLVKSSNGLRW